MSVESPITVAMNWFIGEDRVFEFEVTDATGAVQAITEWALEWTMRTARDASAAVLTKTTAALGITITDGPNGVCQVMLDDSDTIDGSGNILIAPGRYFYTLRRADAGNETVLSFGDAVLQLAASR